MCLLEDTGDQLLHQQVKNLGIHNDAIGIIMPIPAFSFYIWWEKVKNYLKFRSGEFILVSFFKKIDS